MNNIKRQPHILGFGIYQFISVFIAISFFMFQGENILNDAATLIIGSFLYVIIAAVASFLPLLVLVFSIVCFVKIKGYAQKGLMLAYTIVECIHCGIHGFGAICLVGLFGDTFSQSLAGIVFLFVLAYMFVDFVIFVLTIVFYFMYLSKAKAKG